MTVVKWRIKRYKAQQHLRVCSQFISWQSFGSKTRLPRWKCSQGVQPCCAFRLASALLRSKSYARMKCEQTLVLQAVWNRIFQTACNTRSLPATHAFLWYIRRCLYFISRQSFGDQTCRLRFLPCIYAFSLKILPANKCKQPRAFCRQKRRVVFQTACLHQSR